MDLVGLFSAIASPLLAIVGAWIAIRQLEHSKQYDEAQQITVSFERAGIITRRPTGDEATQKVVVEVHYRGFRTLHGIRTCVMFGDGYFWIVSQDDSLAPGERLGPTYLEIPCTSLKGLQLHVSWQSPHPSLRRKGLRYQALRANLNQELQEWRWLPFESLRVKLKLPLGKWVTMDRPRWGVKSLPGWPIGRASKVTSWE